VLVTTLAPLAARAQAACPATGYGVGPTHAAAAGVGAAERQCRRFRPAPAKNTASAHAGRARAPATGRRPPGLRLVSRTQGDRFEVRRGKGWVPFYVKGVNLGVALPGRFPAEFPADSGIYAGWLDTIADMHANAVRVYTMLPPPFYRALGAWNRGHPDHALWLVQGVWTELPPGNDFDDQAWKAEFHREMRRVVDLVHGAAEFPARPGHAGGRYDVNVSPWTLGYIIGREWEPYAVQAYDDRHAPWAFRGRISQCRGAPRPTRGWRSSATICSPTRP
jgi:hypothetical protein